MTAAEIADKLVAVGGDTASLSPAEQEFLMRVLRTWDDMLEALQHVEAIMSIVPPRGALAEYLAGLREVRAAIAKAVGRAP